MENETIPRILIVDDLMSLRKSISQTLRGYDLSIAGNFKEASEMIMQKSFDLAILDIRLENENVWNVDGLYLLNKVKEKNPACGVIIFTGHRDSIRDEALKGYSSVVILEKNATINIRVLRDTVKILLKT